MGDDPNLPSINKLKSMFEGGQKPVLKPVKPPLVPKKNEILSQNGNVPKQTTGSGTDDKQPNSTGAPKRSSLVIPGAFTMDSSENKSPTSTNKPFVQKKPAVASKIDIAKKFENKITSENENKPKPPWMQKPASSDSHQLPPWKQKQILNDSDTPKPVPDWKQKSQLCKELGNKPVPPFKKKADVSNESDKSSTESPSQEGKSTENTGNNVMSRWKKNIEENKTETTIEKSDSDTNKSKSESSEVISFKPSMLRKGSASGFGLLLSDLNTAKKTLSPTSHTSKNKEENKENDAENVPIRPKLPQMRAKPLNKQLSGRRKSWKRSLDDKKFYMIPIDIDSIDTPPPKPPKLMGFIDLEFIIADYKARLKQVENNEDVEDIQVLESDEELYEELPEDCEVPRRQTEKLTRAISIIQPMTAEEEEDQEEEGEYDDTAIPLNTGGSLPTPPLPPLPRSGLSKPLPPTPPPRSGDSDPPEDIHVDGQEDPTADELYEPLDEIISPPPPPVEEVKKEEKKAEKEKEDKKAKEKLEKEKKEREQKKLKEEKKRLEDEKKKLKHWKKQFNVLKSDLEQPQGEGTIKNDDKGSGKHNLEVKKDERVQIIRMTDNPAGKWLVKLQDSDKLGYVESSNVQIDNSLIKCVMEGTYTNTLNLPPPPDELLQDEFYDDVTAGEPTQDDVYEEV